MDNDIFVHFTKTIDDYDVVADKVVMKNDELHEVIVEAIPFGKDTKFRVLDLGSGTGFLMEKILRKFPNVYIVGVDFSENMIKKAEENLKNYKGRYEMIKGDFTEVAFGTGYDLIVSAVAVHNIADEKKIELTKKSSIAMNKGSYFINGDFIEGENEFIDNQYRLIYKDFLENNLKGEELAVWLGHAFGEDMPTSLSKQFKMLTKNGFHDVRLLWQFNNEAVYIAKK
ncbi:MAG: class I SAM-dependent methyltransferase [Candidatus Gracilibacteria bacterium]|nr:class I SAM-dependent methyltransferase [Candidatus Gracilibacteria bacterium]MDD4530553.1 class I SAM-dependent methyltransferase [Candidatus Gracilibacteria bacterium]